MAACAATVDSHSGGYDCQFVDIPQDADLICKICQNPSREPQITVCCGHTFCKSCVDAANLVAGNTIACPMCRCKDFLYVHNKQIERKVNSLYIFCTNRQTGCEWKGELNELDSHLKQTCEFQVIDCPNQCGEQIQRRDLPNHTKETCKCREYTCELCQFIGGYTFVITQHLNECPMFPLTCSHGCTPDPIYRKDLETHEKQCPLAPVKCKYDHIGCSLPIARMNQSKHYKNNKEHHLDLFERSLKLLHNEMTEYKTNNSNLKELLLQRYTAISQQNAKIIELEEQNEKLRNTLSQQGSLIFQYQEEKILLKDFSSQQNSQYKIMINKLSAEKEQLINIIKSQQCVIQEQNTLTYTMTYWYQQLHHRIHKGIEKYGSVIALVSLSCFAASSSIELAIDTWTLFVSSIASCSLIM